jgi:hypothetical protein
MGLAGSVALLALIALVYQAAGSEHQVWIS